MKYRVSQEPRDLIAPRLLIPLGLALAFQEVLLRYINGRPTLTVTSWVLQTSNVISQVGGFLFFVGIIIYLKNILTDGLR